MGANIKKVTFGENVVFFFEILWKYLEWPLTTALRKQRVPWNPDSQHSGNKLSIQISFYEILYTNVYSHFSWDWDFLPPEIHSYQWDSNSLRDDEGGSVTPFCSLIFNVDKPSLWLETAICRPRMTLLGYFLFVECQLSSPRNKICVVNERILKIPSWVLNWDLLIAVSMQSPPDHGDPQHSNCLFYFPSIFSTSKKMLWQMLSEKKMKW